MTMPEFPRSGRGKAGQLRRNAERYRAQAVALREHLAGAQQLFKAAFEREDARRETRDRIAVSAKGARQKGRRS